MMSTNRFPEHLVPPPPQVPSGYITKGIGFPAHRCLICWRVGHEMREFYWLGWWHRLIVGHWPDKDGG